MTVAQRVTFNLVPVDGPIGGFPDAQATANALAEEIEAIHRARPREAAPVFGGWESATRGAGATLQLIGEQLGIADQFQGVDQIEIRDDGSFEVLGARRRRATTGLGLRGSARGSRLGNGQPR